MLVRNRTSLDVVLASQEGVCAVVGEECCTNVLADLLVYLIS